MTSISTDAGPTDAGARDRIVTALDETLFVEAGAGSGKTSSLVGRFVALVLAGADVTGIGAITFTEAAAAELRARTREALEDVVAGRPVRDVAVDDDSVDRARRALADLDRSTISTLHAFAQRLLLSAPVEAGLPPRVEVHDEISSALRTEDRWARFVHRLLDDDSLAEPLGSALSLDIKVEHLEAVAATFNQNWDLLVGLDLSVDRALLIDHEPLRVAVHGLFAAAEEITLLAKECTDESDKLLRWICDVMDGSLDPLRAAATDPHLLLDATSELPKRCRFGQAPAWPQGGKARVFEVWDDAVARIAEARFRITDVVLRRLSVELVDHTLAEAAHRRREGRLEFHDLLVLARQVLRDDVDVRRRLHDRYRYLLIDEFQDTDPIQVELAVRIAADPDHDTSLAWDQVDVDPGRLFFVGDPKQSIYRFRRADIDLFARTAGRHPDGATRLDTNFRTVRPIVEFCNQLFGQLIHEQRVTPDGPMTATSDTAGEVAQPAYADLHAWRTAIDGDPGPAVVLVGVGEKESTADSLRTAEAADIAGTLARAAREGWLVEPAGAPARPCRWGDMAVLLPSRTSLPHLRRALAEAAIPYRLETGSLVYATTEVRDLLSTLRAIDDPGDDIAIVGALRSPAYGCGDDDLLRWRRSGRPWTHLSVDPADATVVDDPVGRALVDLRDRHRSRPFRTVPELVESVVRERALLEVSLAGGNHRDSWRLYRVVVEHARQFADVDPGGLRAFLRWAELQSDDKLRTTVPMLPEADIDAVRIMTVHGAKGLEFGITAVSGLSGQFPSAIRGAVVHFRPTGGFDVRMRSGLETAQFDSRRTVEDVMDEHEGIRLLYVALTRARDHLVVSLHHKPSANVRCHAQRIAAEVDGALLLDVDAVERSDGTSSHRADHGDVAVRPIEPVVPVGAGVSVDARASWVADDQQWSDERARLLHASAGGGATSATAISRRLHLTRDEPPADGERPEPVTEPWRRGRAGTAIGSAVHAVLQHTDLTDVSGGDIAGLAGWQAGVEGIPHAADEIAAKAMAALRSDLVRRAVSGGRWWREVHVGVPISSLVDDVPTTGVDLFEGFVDLLFEDPGGLVVVDYKTDSVPDQRAVDVALERYSSQGAAYAVAVEAATGRPVAEVQFLFLRAGEAVAATVRDLERRCSAVRDELRRVAAEVRP